jgi:uncharacterized protein (DUF2249 family)
VAPGDRVNDVLARDEGLVEVFVRHSSHFTKLRNRTMRKVMGRLVTVDDAARIASIPVDALVRDLNAALGIATHDAAPVPASAPATPVANAASDAGSPRTHPPDARVVEVDVRDDLREGREPLARIMGAVSALAGGEVLRVRAIFHPVPLLTVLGNRGFASESHEHAPDDWSVWFWRESAAETPTVSSRTSEASVGTSSPADDNTVWLDVRGLHPPEPLVRTLAALETLPDGHTLIQLNERVPQLLLPMLAERGFACELDDSHADRVLLRIWRPA